MRIRTSGNNPRISKKELRYVIRFMSEQLMSKRLCENITIYVKSVPTLKGDDDEDLAACVKIIGDDIPPRRFRIWLETNTSRREQLMALAHEITHIKQYAHQELKDDWDRGLHKWKKQTFHEDFNYFFRPWEIECFGYERALYYSYKDHLYTNQISFL